jgi:hypothetical protein
MTTTVTTKSHERYRPLGAAAAVATIILGLGAVGVAIAQNGDESVSQQAPVGQHFSTKADDQRYREYFSGKTLGDENRTRAESSLEGGANATVAEHGLEAAGSSGGGAAFRHFHPTIRHFHTY